MQTAAKKGRGELGGLATTGVLETGQSLKEKKNEKQKTGVKESKGFVGNMKHEALKECGGGGD